jgi:competence protein ComEA
MDPTATPWRVLEDPVERPRTGPVLEATDAARGLVPRTALLMGVAAIALVVLAFGLAFGVGASGTVVLDGGTPLGSADAADGSLPSPGLSSSDPELVVEIVGAIDRPGVFRLPAGARVGDLVEAAGGYGLRVDAERASRELNLAAPLHDGDQVRVPSRDDEETAGVAIAPGSGPGADVTSHPGSSGTSLVELNTATSAELEALPGIGPVTAAKILASREEQRFGAVEDLRTRGMLGAKTYEKVKDLVTVR